MSDHDWCRDVRRDEQVRAAEDAAAVPAIQHRDLPEVVAELRETVARLEAELMAKLASVSSAKSLENKGDTMPDAFLRTERVTLEVTHNCMYPAAEWILEEVQGACCDPGESARVVEADEIARLTAERDAAIRERRAANEEVEDWSRRCGRILDERDAARARVAELEAAPAANAGGEKPEPVAWGVMSSANLPHRVALHWDQELAERSARAKQIDYTTKLVSFPLYAAPPPRDWLTAEEREAVEEAMVDYASNVGDHDCERIERVLRALLARETPPKVKVPAWLHADVRGVVADAIRAAGGEVEG